jgi:hypothetical protein
MPSGGKRNRSGPPKKPRELKVLEGSFRKDRDGNPPAVVGGFPLPPTELTADERILWESLPHAAWIGQTDTIGVWAAVDIFARLLALRRAERETGEPANDAALKLWGALRSWLVELGLTPASRSKVEAPKVDAAIEDKWAGIL